MFTRLHKVPLQQLQDFISSAEGVDFRAAAKGPGRPVWGILQFVQNLEALMGLKLFSRLPSPIRITADGEILLPYAHAIVDSIADLTSRLAEKDGKLY
jgi:DNA-binding transcriptional LysR family regulator